MTSNIRSQAQLLEHFRPEFVNRIDEIVVFEALTRDQIGVDRRAPARAPARPARGAQDRARAVRRGGRADRRGRLGSGVRRAAAEAGDPAARREPARARAARGPLRRRRHGAGDRRRRLDPLRARGCGPRRRRVGAGRLTKQYRHSLWRRGLNGLVRPLARLGLTGPRTYLLTVPGRVSGRPWSTPVSIVTEGDERWLVAPSGERNWVKNARAATTVELRRGRQRQRYRVEELDPADAVPVLRRYFALGRVTRPSSTSRSSRRRRSGGPRRRGIRCSSSIGCRSEPSCAEAPAASRGRGRRPRPRIRRCVRRRSSRCGCGTGGRCAGGRRGGRCSCSSTGGLAGDGAAATTSGSTMTVFMALMKHAVAVALL